MDAEILQDTVKHHGAIRKNTSEVVRHWLLRANSKVILVCSPKAYGVAFYFLKVRTCFSVLRRAVCGSQHFVLPADTRWRFCRLDSFKERHRTRKTSTGNRETHDRVTATLVTAASAEERVPRMTRHHRMPLGAVSKEEQAPKPIYE